MVSDELEDWDESGNMILESIGSNWSVIYYSIYKYGTYLVYQENK